MIQIENIEVMGWEHVIRGMRNPMNSWDNSDSGVCKAGDSGIDCSNCSEENYCGHTWDHAFHIGKNDHELMMKLAKGGAVHAKYRRMIIVYMDVTAPLYWWKEFDTYKVGTVANSCSTMHKIHAKEFTLEDFSHEHLISDWNGDNIESFADVVDPRGGVTMKSPKDILGIIIDALNTNRRAFIDTQDKRYWWQMIQLLPSSYNQKRTVMLNYEVLANIDVHREGHKLDEWHKFLEVVRELPYSEIFMQKTEQPTRKGHDILDNIMNKYKDSSIAGIKLDELNALSGTHLAARTLNDFSLMSRIESFLTDINYHYWRDNMKAGNYTKIYDELNGLSAPDSQYADNIKP
jgi:hypothetical protein